MTPEELAQQANNLKEGLPPPTIKGFFMKKFKKYFTTISVFVFSLALILSCQYGYLYMEKRWRIYKRQVITEEVSKFFSVRPVEVTTKGKEVDFNTLTEEELKQALYVCTVRQDQYSSLLTTVHEMSEGL